MDSRIFHENNFFLPEHCETSDHGTKETSKSGKAGSLAVKICAALLAAVSVTVQCSLIISSANRRNLTDTLLSQVLPEHISKTAESSEYLNNADDSDISTEPAPDSQAAPGDSISPADLSSKAPQGAELKNETSYAPDLALLSAKAAVSTAGGKSKKTVLIYHTHGTEAYENGDDVCAETGFRSKDTDKNVVAVGGVISRTLEKCGVTVIHLEEMFDSESWSKAYDKSSAAVQKILSERNDIGYIFDVHRDAVGTQEDGYIKALDKTCLGDTAQMMFVCGTDEGGSAHKQWRQNLAFALRLQAGLWDESNTLMRPINLRRASFYQDMSQGALLLEVGTAGNSLAEAKRAGIMFALELAGYISEKEPPISAEEASRDEDLDKEG